MTEYKKSQQVETTGLINLNKYNNYTLNTPQQLQTLSQWILYRTVLNPERGKWDKLPTSPNTGMNCSVKDGKQWLSFSDSLKAWQTNFPNLQGLGLCLASGIVVVDLDNALDENKQPLEWVLPILAIMPATFTEISQSGKGLHLFLKGVIGQRRNRWNLPSGHHIELYEKDRFIAFTADRFQNAPLILTDGEEALNHLYENFFPKSLEKLTVPFNPTTNKANLPQLSSHALLEKMFQSTHGTDIQALWHGDSSKQGNDESRADLALLNHLAWWTNGDASQMEALFNQSALGQREKWQTRKDYRDRTINTILNGFSGGYRGEATALRTESPETTGFLQWEESLSLSKKMLEVAPFPVECLPDSLRLWLIDCSERIQCPIDYIAVGAMVVLATVVGRKMGIMPKRKDDWLVIPNLWGMIVGPPSVMKTPSLREPMRGLETLEKAGASQHKQALKAWEAKQMIQEEQKKKLKEGIKKSLKNNEDPMETIMASLQAMEEEPPHRKRFIVNDTTVEKLGEILSENPNGVLMFRDELTGFFNSMEKTGHELDRAFYLEAWNGDKGFTYDRIGRGTVDIESVCVSILGGIQPSPLANYIRQALSNGSGNDGLLQRFQLGVFPDISPNWKNVDEYPNKAMQEEAFATIHRLHALDFNQCGATLEEGGKFPSLRFTEEAQRMFDDWRSQLEHEIRSSEEHPALIAHFSKYRSFIPTLALLTHLAENGNGAVTLTALEKALKWDAYLRTHARRIYSLGENSPTDSAERLLNRIKKKQLNNPFTLREVYHKAWSGLNTPEAVRQAVEVLEAHAMVQQVKEPTTGRPKELIYINPDVLNA